MAASRKIVVHTQVTLHTGSAGITASPPARAVAGAASRTLPWAERSPRSPQGGGTVEGYPEETDDRKVSGSYLHTGPMAAFENHGFTPQPADLAAPLGRHPTRRPRLTGESLSSPWGSGGFR